MVTTSEPARAPAAAASSTISAIKARGSGIAGWAAQWYGKGRLVQEQGRCGRGTTASRTNTGELKWWAGPKSSLFDGRPSIHLYLGRTATPSRICALLTSG